MKARGGNLLRDVYRDLRDRRLLSIAIVLVAAIVAVPFLIGSDAESGEPAGGSSPADPVEGAEALEPVVTAAGTELRDYERRLDRFQLQNPFKQQLTEPLGGSLTDTSLTDTSESASATGETESADLDDSTSTAPVDTEDTGEDDPTDPGRPVEDPGAVLYSTRIDVRVGPVGDTEVVREVKEFEYLPDPSTPVVQHLFGEFDLTAAAFVVSPAAVAIEGDGRCEPSPQACQFLLLEVGEEQKFEYDDGVTYRLQLLDVSLHEEVLEGGLPSGKDATDTAGGFAAGREPGDLTAD